MHSFEPLRHLCCFVRGNNPFLFNTRVSYLQTPLGLRHSALLFQQSLVWPRDQNNTKPSSASTMTPKQPLSQLHDLHFFRFDAIDLAIGNLPSAVAAELTVRATASSDGRKIAPSLALALFPSRTSPPPSFLQNDTLILSRNELCSVTIRISVSSVTTDARTLFSNENHPLVLSNLPVVICLHRGC